MSTCAQKQFVSGSVVYKNGETLHVCLLQQHQHVKHGDRGTRPLTPQTWSQAVPLFWSENVVFKRFEWVSHCYKSLVCAVRFV